MDCQVDDCLTTFFELRDEGKGHPLKPNRILPRQGHSEDWLLKVGRNGKTLKRERNDPLQRFVQGLTELHYPLSWPCS